jgi:hypothetical protein
METLKSEGKKPFRIPRRTWPDNIKIDLKEVGYGMDLTCSG